jgi:hypothetical protein
MRSLMTLALGGLLIAAHAASAQTREPVLPSRPVILSAGSWSMAPPKLSPEQNEDLAQWLDEMNRWQRQQKRWPNEPVHNNYGKIVSRRAEPPAPGWLAAYCAGIKGFSPASLPQHVDQACRLLAGLAVDLQAEAIRQQTLTARADQEKVVKSSFLSRVHIDGLWTTTSSDVRYYGLVGSHISLVDIGRVQFFGPPGILLLRMPDGTGSHQIRVGYTWGMSVRLADLRVLGPRKNMTLFLSVTKCWTVGNSADRLRPGGFDIAGFSIAPRKRGD